MITSGYISYGRKKGRRQERKEKRKRQEMVLRFCDGTVQLGVA
jgi:hypothetical protein